MSSLWGRPLQTRSFGNFTKGAGARGTKRRRTNWAGSRYGGMPPTMRGYYRRSGFWRRDGRTPGGSVEMKFYDRGQIDSGNDLSLGVVVMATDAAGGGLLAGLSQGTGEQMRIGRKIIVKSVYIRAHLRLSSSLGQGNNKNGQLVRLMLIEDRQCNGADATTADMFESVPGGGHKFNQMNNLANKNRFKVHKDKVYTLNYPEAGINSAGTLYYQQGKAVPIKIYKKFNLPVEFSGTGASTIANIQSSNLFLYIQALTTDTNIQFDGVSRVRFVG